jgi:hypothetical protein
MKNLQSLHHFFTGVLLFIIFSACNKNDSNLNPITKCRLSTASDNVGHISNSFLYDDSNRLITLIHVSDYDPYTKHLSYKGDSIISYIDAGVNSSTDTIVLNSFGLIATDRQVISSNGTVRNTFYTYDAKGVLMSSSNGLNTSIVNFTFINGDNIYQTYNDQGNISVDTLSYYTDKPLVPVDFNQYNQYVFYGAYYYKNKHMGKSYQSAPYHGEYTYDFDGNGNVSTLYSDFGIGKDTVRFTYICP